MSVPELGYEHRWTPSPVTGAPTLLLLHGTGGDENDLLPLGRMIDPNAALLSPRGNVLENGMPRFFRRFAEGVFDVEDVARRARELATFVRRAAERYGFAEDSVIAVGFSNGANVAGAVGLLSPSVLRGGVLLRAQDVLGEAGLGARHSALGEDLDDSVGHAADYLLLAGTMDPIVPRAETEKLAARLREVGARVTVRWEEASHTITPGDIDAARTWLAGVWRRA